ncbi:unnamed protein product, partial [Mesorhabditis belari]|uniref:Acyltransferase 3 domain-containing protein n=1 Tax=Mesorhabditis belari TaxID=2138241 RepID=A0AAF3EKW3_9BILA
MKEMDIEKSAYIHESIRYVEVIEHRKGIPAFREDIALVRALAILAVLSFHFWPTIFPSGYLGVDIFFVISGYLMIVVLERSAKMAPLQMFIDFYYKRPFGHKDISSTLLALNLKMVSIDGDYFEQINEETPFLHFWSLSVEMQFYLIAPIIFLCSKMRINDYHVGPLILIVILLASLKFRLESTPITAFYNPFTRLWQFLLGMLSSIFALKQEATEQNQKIEALAAIFFWPIFLVFLPFNSMNEKWMQIFVTVTAGLFMAIAPARWEFIDSQD